MMGKPKIKLTFRFKSIDDLFYYKTLPGGFHHKMIYLSLISIKPQQAVQ